MIPDEALVDRIPVRTPTLPPATHTNVWCLGDRAITVIDPASPYEEEQTLLFEGLQARMDQGARIERIVLTHHHPDHVGGVVALRDRLAAMGQVVPILAHDATTALVDFDVDASLSDGDAIDVSGVQWVARHTPGHAPGHLVLHQPETGVIVAGDLVAGVSTIIIDPREGNLGHYLASLEAARAWNPTVLLPAHGDPLPPQILTDYIDHRHARTDQIRAVLAPRPGSAPLDLVPEIYPELPEMMHGFAAIQVLAHLLWLQEQGEAVTTEGQWAMA
ncbi:MAG: MBL fold metallo-hydrolase [Myxococcota bacterium]